MERCKCCLSNVLIWSKDRLGRRCLERKESRANKSVLSIVQYFAKPAYWPVDDYMASYSNPGQSAQVWSAGIARLLPIPKHVGPSQQGGGPSPTPDIILSKALQSAV